MYCQPDCDCLNCIHLNRSKGECGYSKDIKITSCEKMRESNLCPIIDCIEYYPYETE